MKKKVRLNPEQEQELLDLSRHGKLSHVRLKARAVYNVGQGTPRAVVAEMLGVERRSVGRWVQRYIAEGAMCFNIREGRGRKALVNAEEVGQYLRQSPGHFGITRTRWTLGTLKEVVPSMRGMTDSGVWRSLKRLEYRYKRGQPVVHSPDPGYEEKRGP